jgi:CBS domain-containing membrane protein
VVAPVHRRFLTLSVIDTAAIGISVWALVFINQKTTPDHLPLLVASLAASAIVLFSLSGLDIARSWNVIAGQFLRAFAAFVSVALLGDHPAIVAGSAVALAFVLMRLAHALHPPGASTAMIMAPVPGDHGVRFPFFPVLAGAITITVFAWLVHLLERLLMARVNRGTPGS